MRSKSVPAGQGAEGAAPVAAEARGAEGVGDRRIAEADHERALEHQRHALDQAPRPRLDPLEVGELVAQRGRGGVEARVGAGGLVDLGEEGLERLRPADHRPQHVEALDVARALPDRVQRRLAIEARHPRLLDVAVAAEALERLAGVRDGPLAEPVLEHRVGDPLELRLALVAGDRFVVGAREAHRADRRRLGLDREVGEHVSHQRLVDQQRAERRALRGVVDRRGDPRAHPGGGAEAAVEAGVVDHLDDRRHAATLLADHPRPGAAELDLAGGVRAVAELVLEPLDLDRVALAVGGEARHQKAGEPALGLGEDEERVAHRRRHEPLVAGERVLGARAAAVQRRRRRWCWRARPSRPASRSSPCRTGRRACRRRGAARRRSASEVKRGSHSAAISGCLRSAGITE